MSLGLKNRIKRLWKHWENYSVEEWNGQYASSKWAYLGSLEQLPRYAVIEGWRRHLKPSGRVLDVGCGEGVLLDQIPAESNIAYVGVDFAETAIDAALRKPRDHQRVHFVCADAMTFDPPMGAGFDVIVFNEVLYYFADPLSLLHRYRRFLAPAGILIVSIFHANVHTWTTVNAELGDSGVQRIVLHEVASDKRWYLGVYAPDRGQELETRE